MFSTPNMGLTVWNLLGDLFDHTQLEANLVAIDAHNHSGGEGVQVPTAGIANGAITAAKLATGAVTAAALAAAVQELMFSPGDIKASAVPAAPTGWLLCDGTSYTQASYPNLFAAIGAAYGSVDGTHFNVPDLRGRSPIGSGTGTAAHASTWTLGHQAISGAGGEEQHVLTVGELASHLHQGLWLGPPGFFDQSFNAVQQELDPGTTFTGLQTSINTVNQPFYTGNAGSNQPHNTMQPVSVVNFFIKY